MLQGKKAGLNENLKCSRGGTSVGMELPKKLFFIKHVLFFKRLITF